MDQSVKCLLSMLEDLSSDLRLSCKKTGTAVYTCNPSTGEAETGFLASQSS